VVPSSSLVPIDDPTLLFTNAGMNQFKDVFTGKRKPSYKRATSSQKCMRVSGKHNDLEEVGPSPFHHTFFEMLGNFSFGDYFKEDAIYFAWEYMTQVLKLPKERLYITVFNDDDEAYSLWERVDDFLKKGARIRRFGKKDNYWSMGDTGPNGPCSEIHYDRGEGYSGELNGFGNRYLELWNLVFMQYNRDENGELTPLPKPSIDTGAGLERLSLVLQGKNSNYDTDLFSPLIKRIEELSAREYFPDERGTSHRVIADHLRALAFCFSDGAYPSNEGRGYVLRRILRRASYHSRLLGVYEPFIYKLVPNLVDMMADIYPELQEKKIHTSELIKSEEESFNRTLDRGLEIFSDIVRRLKVRGEKVIPGKEAFKLYDTYGFPLDLTKIMAEKERLDVDTDGYQAELSKQQKRSREGIKGVIKGDVSTLVSEFRGYYTDSLETEILDIALDGDVLKIILSETPFYAESGGQIGDSGVIVGLDKDYQIKIIDTRKQGEAIIHISEPQEHIKTIPRVGDRVKAVIDNERRNAIKRNHTATHLLHRALRDILGEHSTQGGSYVGPDRLRFDFSHYKALTDDEISKIEEQVNRTILSDYEVYVAEDVPIEKAREEGAMALFGEKYGEVVRVIKILKPDNSIYSIELCGGTHTGRTGEIGSFVIVSESAIAAGLRRIEALTGLGALNYFKARDNLIRSLSEILKATPEEISDRVKALLDNNRELDRELKEFGKLKAVGRALELIKDSIEINGYRIVSSNIDASDRREMLDLADALRDKLGSGIGVLGSVIGGKASLCVVITDDLIKSKDLKAGEIVKRIAPLINGSGGGKAHLAQAGGKSINKLPEAIRKAPDIIRDFLIKKG